MDAVALWDPKLDGDRADWEDGVAYDRGSGWFSVADGASTGIGSREWAYALTASFVRARPAEIFASAETGCDDFGRWADGARSEFDRLMETRTLQVPGWVRDAGAREGAYATMLGGWIDGSVLRMVAVGDCCAFIVRCDAPVHSFPLLKTADFGQQPDLIGSKRNHDAAPGASTCRSVAFTLSIGDEVVVASDALAEWLIGRRGDTDAWRTILTVTDAGFRELVRDLRHHRLMKNDDVTLLRCRPAARHPATRGGRR